MATNRETERDILVGLVNGAMVGDGLPLQACYGYQDVKSWPGQKSPVMVISSAGTERIKVAAGDGGWQTTFFFNADVFVLYACVVQFSHDMWQINAHPLPGASYV